MPYIGNPIYQSAFVTDQFSGDGTTTAYTMSVAPAGVSNVLVAVSGVLQDPSTYGVVGNTLTFTAAPPSGTGNISVRYLGVPVTGVVTTAYRTVTEFTATASQTTFTPPSYNVGFINVYLNGVLLASTDYTATNGTTVVLTTGASAGNILTVESFRIESVANAIPNAAGAVTDSNINTVSASKLTGSQTIPKATLPTGSVLQVVNSTYWTEVSSSTNTWIDTGLTATITPTSATSKVLVIVNQAGCLKTASNTYLQVMLLRDSTQIKWIESYGGSTSTTAENAFGSVGGNYLDSPATTSAVTYKTQFRSGANSSNVRVNFQAGAGAYSESSITLMEIAA